MRPGVPPTRGRHRRRRSAWARVALALAFAALAVLSGVAGVRLLDGIRLLPPSDAGEVPSAATGQAAPERRAGGSTAGRPTARASTPERSKAPQSVPPGIPTRLALPDSDVTARILPVGTLSNGQLRLPESPDVVGWWVRSAPVGDPTDSTVLAGHVDSARTGVGALAALRDMEVGDRVLVTDAFGGRHDYKLAARRDYPKYELPDDVFAVRGRPRLVLITCGGPFDEKTGRYRDNVVGYAVPA